jgi:multimeric flavodoxin WrbA
VKTGIVYDSSDAEARALFEVIKAEAGAASEEVAVIDVAANAAAPCICCFKCWTKTPGECILPHDGGTEFAEKFWNAAYVVLISKITWGGYSASVKMYHDRLIPILHPYFRKVNGEMHHQLRYDSLPIFLAAGYGAGSPGEEETFLGYTAATRDQTGVVRPGGTFIVRRGENAAGVAESCAAWAKKELVAEAKK